MYKSEYEEIATLMASVADAQLRTILVKILQAIREISPGADSEE